MLARNISAETAHEFRARQTHLACASQDLKERMTLSIICDGPVDGLRIGGRGENWTVRFVFQPVITFPMWFSFGGFVLIVGGLVSMFMMMAFDAPVRYGALSICCVLWAS